MLDVGRARRQLRRGAFGAVGLGIVSGVTIDPAPGAAMVAAGAVAIALDERLVRSRIPMWGED